MMPFIDVAMMDLNTKNLADSPTSALAMTDTLVPKTRAIRFWTPRTLTLHVTGPQGTRDVVLDRPFARIGSHPDSELCLSGPGVERRHAYLHLAPEGVYCLDFVAGQRREKQAGFWVDSQQPVLIGDHQIFVRVALPSGETQDVDLPIAQEDNPRLPGVAPTVSPIRSRKQPRFRLRDRFTCIGRLPGNRIRQESEQLSQFHCVVARHDDQLWLIDLLTTNGSTVNGQPVDVGLIPGPEAEVVLASTPLRFVLPPGKKSSSATKSPLPTSVGLDRVRRQAVLDAREAALRVMAQELASQREACQREREIIARQTARHLQQVTEADSERFASEQQLAEREQSLSARAAELESLAQAHQQQERQLQAAEQQLAAREQELQQRLSDLESRLQEERLQEERLQDERQQDERAEIARQAALLATAQRQLAELEDQRQAALQELAQRQAAQKDWERERVEWQRDLAVAATESHRLEAERRDWERERTILAAAVHDLRRTWPRFTSQDATSNVARSVPVQASIEGDCPASSSLAEEIVVLMSDQQLAIEQLQSEWQSRESELLARITAQSEEIESGATQWREQLVAIWSAIVARSVSVGSTVDPSIDGSASPHDLTAAITARIHDNQAALEHRLAEWERREAELQTALTEATRRWDQAQRDRAEFVASLAAERSSVAQWQRQVQELNDRVAALAAATENDRGEQQAERSAAQAMAVQAEEEWAQRQAALDARQRELEQREQEFIKSHQQLEQARLVFEREMLIHGSQVKVLAKLGQLDAEKSWWYRIWHPFQRTSGQ